MLYFLDPQNKMIKIETAVGLTEALEKNGWDLSFHKH